MKTKTESETLFESFCDRNRLPWKTILTGDARAPDYRVCFGSEAVHFEVKQLDKDEAFSTSGDLSKRTVGDHIRRKIAASRSQLQADSRAGIPSVLVVYNNLDPMQSFGTESHDFLAAMYGELTVVLKGREGSNSFHGRNSMLREGHNSSFNAVAHLRASPHGPSLWLYENVFARSPLNFATIPECIEVVCIEVSNGAA